ncbi:MAG: gas vesicle protein [Chloroflexi bacterium]|nr:gas vesicle protein [Chloroflexota bacterium]
MTTGPKIAKRAREQLEQLTGLKPDTVSGLSKDEEGWHVTVEMIELQRIPAATDVLAAYEALLDDEGNLIRYERTRRYLRDQVTAER